MGETQDKNGKICYKGTVPTIMAHRGFNIKIMIQDGEDHEEVLEQFSSANLGIPWDTKEDKICMHFEVNTSPKI